MHPVLIDGGSERAQTSLLLAVIAGQTSSLTGAKGQVKIAVHALVTSVFAGISPLPAFIQEKRCVILKPRAFISAARDLGLAHDCPSRSSCGLSRFPSNVSHVIL